MQYIIYFDVAAILLNAALLLIVYMRRTYPTKSCTLYKLMLWLNLASSCADLISAYMISFPQRFPLVLNYAANMVYLIAHNMTAVVFLLYVIVLVRGDFGTKMELIFWQSIVIFEAALVLTSPFTRFVFYFDENKVYHHGPLVLVLYCAAAAILFYAVVLFIRHRRIMNEYQMATNIAFLSLLMGAVVFQYFHPLVLVESFCVAISVMMLNVALDNPALYFYKNSYCFNQAAFDTTMAGKLKSNAIFSVLAFTFDDLALFRKQYGVEIYDTIIENTINACHKLYGQKSVYLLADDNFAIDLRYGDVDQAVEKLTAAVSGEVRAGDTVITLRPHFCVFRHPGFAETVSDINDAISNMLFSVYQKNGKRVIHNSTKLLDAKHRESYVIHCLRDAIQNDGFDIFYQPLYEQRTGRYISAEALIRLKQQGDGSSRIGPDEFIPIAEENGLILQIGEIVFDKVCRFWRDADLASLGIEYIEVNLSMLQLLHKSSVRLLESICQKYGVSPEHINLEVTETAGASPDEKEKINECIEYLREKGFTFSLDDYGSGYATASYLAEMPFKIVKIDKSILWNAMKQQSFQAVLKSSVHLVRAFDRECVAEGVETPEMVSVLTELGCDFFQGYLYSRPISEVDFIRFLRQNQKHD